MEKVKVLHIIPGYGFGGIETTTMNLFKYLKDSKKISIEIIVERQSNMYPIEQLINEGCKVHVIDKMNFKRPFKYYNEMKLILNKKDYSIVHSYSITRTPIFLLAAKTKGIRNRIFHARANLSSTKFIKRIMFRFLILIGIELSTDLFACSEQAGKYFFRNERFNVIKNGIDTKKYLYNEKIRNEIRSTLNIKDRFVIGHVGRFCEVKNHKFIIEIFAKISKMNNKAVLLLIGDGPTMDGVKQKVNEYNIVDKVIFIGASSKVSEYLQAMDIFIFPSLYEGFGNVAIEAQVAGLKVIASDNIPKSVKMSDLVEFISLDESKDKWLDALLNESNQIRRSRDKEIIDNGYDIQTVSENIKNFYLEMN